MPDYVILHHQLPEGSDRLSHWDVMFHLGDTLLTWAVEDAPSPGLRVAARALENHRIEYLDYSGPVSGNRGVVTRWDRGSYSGDPSGSTSFCVHLEGDRFEGLLKLEAVEGEADQWWITFPGST
jgi:hypothetical protein